MQMIKYSISILLSFLSMVSCGQITVNQPRMEKRITELAQFGKDANGRGYRVGYIQKGIWKAGLILWG